MLLVFNVIISMKKHICPVCGNASGCGTFRCPGCVGEKWVHPKCGGYLAVEVQLAAKKGDQGELRCNNWVLIN